MPEVNAMVADDPTLYEGFTAEEEEEMLQELQEQRDVNQTGTRGNNLASQKVARGVIDRIGEMVSLPLRSMFAALMANGADVVVEREHGHDRHRHVHAHALPR